ncbi:MAG: GntR family transcriptional regulator [Rhodococcus sp. (in: high G+C Gram-positive bacteria)]
MTQGSDVRLPLHARLRDELSRRISDGEWGPTTALPSEAELAQQYEVSVGTMRRVLGDLVSAGALDRRQGRGTFVRRPSFGNALFRFFRARGDGDRVPDARILGREREQPSATVATELGGPDEVLHLRRLRLWGTKPFLAEDIWLPLPTFLPLVDIDVDEIGPLLYPAYERLTGVVVGTATEELSVTVADSDIAEKLDCREDEPLMRIARTARTYAGDTIEYRVSYGVASAFSYRLELQ